MLLLGALLLAQVPGAIPLSSLAPGAALRIEAGRLVLKEAGKEPVLVRKPDDLRDRVRIVTDAAALEYVRLLRMPGLWPLLFDKPILEVRKQPVVLPSAVYSDLRIYTISGWDGVVSDADWTRLGLPEPKVAGGRGKDWSVRRPCLLKEGDRYRLGTLVERVSEAGRYVWAVERPEDAPRSVKWAITGVRR